MKLKTEVELTEANKENEAEKRHGNLTEFPNRSSRHESALTFPDFEWSGLTSAATKFRATAQSLFPSFPSVENQFQTLR
jgi:hypothetical protein